LIITTRCCASGANGSQLANGVTPPGRSGPGQVWLASPPTVVASALAGELASFAELQRRYGA
jgi:homoaconitase/3-isopropylmalate dehydratase large subunit